MDCRFSRTYNLNPTPDRRDSYYLDLPLVCEGDCDLIALKCHLVPALQIMKRYQAQHDDAPQVYVVLQEEFLLILHPSK